MDNAIKLSVVSPVYGSPDLIPVLCERLHRTLQTVTEHYEILLVFDCSPDDGWQRICTECGRDPRVKGILLSRNFGQHYAIMAGLSLASGEHVVVMDCDLQDVPEEIPRLYAKAREGYDVVLGQRIEREDSWFKKKQSALFHAVFGYLTDRASDPAVANFGVYHAKVIREVLGFGDYIKCFPLIVAYLGFKTARVPVEHAARESGKSSYTLMKALTFSANLMLTYSNKPLRLMTGGGFLVVMISLLISLYYLVLHLSGLVCVTGFTSLILSIWLVGGVIMTQVGVVGIYLGRVFNQTKNRPVFVIDEVCNLPDRSAPDSASKAGHAS